MKFLVATLLTALLSFVAGLYMDWWGLAVAAFVVAVLVHQRAIKSLLAGFVGVFLMWGGLAWWIDSKNGGILSAKIATLLPLSGNSNLLILVTAIVGGLVAAAGAITGSFLRSSNKQLS